MLDLINNAISIAIFVTMCIVLPFSLIAMAISYMRNRIDKSHTYFVVFAFSIFTTFLLTLLYSIIVILKKEAMEVSVLVSLFVMTAMAGAYLYHIITKGVDNNIVSIEKFRSKSKKEN